MKLRLPNKLQAALMAALASVSFTTLSSGTLSAAFFFGSQAFAEEAANKSAAPIDTGDTNLDAQVAINEAEGKGEAKQPDSTPTGHVGSNGVIGSSDDFDRQSTAEATTESSIDTENVGTAGQANYTGTSADLPSDDLGFTSNPYASGSSNGSGVDSPVTSFTQAPQIAPTGGDSAAGIGSGSSTNKTTTGAIGSVARPMALTASNLLSPVSSLSVGVTTGGLSVGTGSSGSALPALTGAAGSVASAPTYSGDNLVTPFTDAENHVVYNGFGTFYVQTKTNVLSLQVTLCLESLAEMQAVHDYHEYSPSVTWAYEGYSAYGLSDFKTTDASGLTGYWNGAKWTNQGTISYSSLMEESQAGADGKHYVTLDIINQPSQQTGSVLVSTNGEQIYSGDGLRSSNFTGPVTSFTINTQYITSVTLNSTSVLDVEHFDPPIDYSIPFVSQKTDGNTVGRIMFIGDSITHGEYDATWRWQLFKSFVDNDTEYQIAGPKAGLNHTTPFTTTDFNITGENSYGGVEFDNLHYAQSSGRTRNIINGGGVAATYNYVVNGESHTDTTGAGASYGGSANSADKVGQRYDCNSYVMLMGTNDLLSDTRDNDYVEKYVEIAKSLLGGSVTGTGDQQGNRTLSWSRTDSDGWGNVGTIISEMNMVEGDTFYLLSVPTWARSGNHNNYADHTSALAYNSLLSQWVEAYNAAHANQGTVVYVDINKGLVDVTENIPFYSNRAFFNNGKDGLHPSQQGSLIIAGNIAQAIGLGGRTAGLSRADATTEGTSWTAADQIQMKLTSAGAPVTLASGAFSAAQGYTVDFQGLFGDGAVGGWLDASKDYANSVSMLTTFSTVSNALTFTVGDGTSTGTLKLSEGYVLWNDAQGDHVLYSRDNSQAGDNLRIAYTAGSVEDNIGAGYYVWLGDMLIGQALSAGTGTALNGISISVSGTGTGTVNRLTYSNTGYAPLIGASPIPVPSHDNTPTHSGVDFTGATTINNQKGITSSSQFAGDAVFEQSDRSGWIAASGVDFAHSITAKIDGGNTITASIFGVQGGTTQGDVTLDISNVTIGDQGTYSGAKAAIAGAYSAANIVGTFTVYVTNSTIGGNIVGGAVGNSGSVGAFELYLNSGSVNGSIYGGPNGGNNAGGTIGDVSITINAGHVTGDINGGAQKGSVTGDSAIVIKGGIIDGNIIGGNVAGTSSITIESNKPLIGGSITADSVVIRNVTPAGVDDFFDTYAGTITGNTSITLDGYAVEDMTAKLVTQRLNLVNSSSTIIRDLTLTACEINVDGTSSATLADSVTLGNTATYTGTLNLADGLEIDVTGMGITGEEKSVNLFTTQSGTLNADASQLTIVGLAQDAPEYHLRNTNNNLVLTFGAPPQDLIWDHASGTTKWDVATTQNWHKDGEQAGSSTFAEGDNVTFQSGAGTAQLQDNITAGTMTLQSGANLTVDTNNNNLTVANLVSANGSNLTKTGAGTATFGGDANTPVSLGTLTVSGGTANFEGGPVTANKFTTSGADTAVTFDEKVTLTGSRVEINYNWNATSNSITFAKGLDFTGAGTNNYAMAIGNGDTVSLGGVSDFHDKALGIASRGGAFGKLVLLEDATLSIGRTWNTGTAAENGAVELREGSVLNISGNGGGSTISKLSGSGTVNVNAQTLLVDGNENFTGNIALANTGALDINATNFGGKIANNGTGTVTMYGTAGQVANENARIAVTKKTDQQLILAAGSETAISKVTVASGNTTWLLVGATAQNDADLYTDIDFKATGTNQNGLILNTANTTSHIGSLSSDTANTQVRGDWDSQTGGRVLAVHQDDDTTFAGYFMDNKVRSVGLDKYGEGTLTLTGQNVSASAMNIYEGTIKLADSGKWTGDTTVHDDGTLALTGSVTNLANTVSISEGGTLTLGGYDSGAVTAANLTLASGSILDLTGLTGITGAETGEITLIKGGSITAENLGAVTLNFADSSLQDRANLSMSGSNLVLTFTPLAKELIWDGANGTKWDSGNNWHAAATPDTHIAFTEGDDVRFSSGYTNNLTLGGNVTTGDMKLDEGVTVKLSAANHTLTVGGTLNLGNGSTLEVNPGGSGNRITNLGNVNVNGTATIDTLAGGWNPEININALTGADGSELNLSNRNQVNIATVYNLNGGEGSDFLGDINLRQNQANTGNARLLAMNINSGAATQLENSVVTFYSTNITQSHVGLGVNADATIKGLVSESGNTAAQHAVFSGAATTNTGSFSSSESKHTLTIATDGGNYSTRADVLANVNLKKTEAGSQSFTGNLSAMNGTLEVQQGTLTLDNSGANAGKLASVKVNGGTLVLDDMNVAGAITLSGGELDLLSSTTTIGSLNMTGGTLKLAGANGLTSTGTLSFSDGAILDLTNIHPSGSAESITLATASGITGNLDAVLLTNITAPEGFKYALENSNNNLVLTFTPLTQDLIWDGTNDATWDSGNNWHAADGEPGSTAFNTGDNVQFTAEYQAKTATLVNDVTAGNMVVDSNATATVDTAGNSLTVASLSGADSAKGGNLVKLGEGTATVNGTVNMNDVTVTDGTLEFTEESTVNRIVAGGTNGVIAGDGPISVVATAQDHGVEINSKDQALTITAGELDIKTSLYNKGTLTVGDGENETLVKTKYFVNGNVQDRSYNSSFEIKSNATVAISGGDNEGSTHNTGLVLSEWENETTGTVAGKLLAPNATLLSGNTDAFTLNIADGGLVAVKGIKSKGSKAYTVNLNDGGTLVFGGTTSANNNGTLVAQAGSTIGISADTASYNAAIQLGAAEGRSVTVDTAKYVFTEDGTDISQGSTGGNLTLSGVISGTGSLTKEGAGTLTLNGNNTFSGNVTVNEGILKVGNNNALGTMSGNREIKIATGGTLDVNGKQGNAADNFAVELAGGTLANTASGLSYGTRQFVSSAKITADSTIQADKVFGFTAGSYAAITVKFTDGTVLEKKGSADFVVTNATVTGKGTFKVSEGNLRFQDSVTSSANFIMNGGSVSSGDRSGSLQLSDAISVTTDKNSTFSVPMNTNGNAVTFTGSANLEVSGGISGSGSITKTGDGTVVLTGNNSYTGGTTVSGGKLVAGSANALGIGDVLVNNGGALELTSSLTSISGNLTVNDGTLTFAGPENLTTTGEFTFGSGATLDLTNIHPGSFTDPITLATATGGISGDVGAVTLTNLVAPEGYKGILSTVGNDLVLTFTEQRDLVWQGGSGDWNADTSNHSWYLSTDSSQKVAFQDGDNVSFLIPGNSPVSVTENIAAGDVFVDADVNVSLSNGSTTGEVELDAGAIDVKGDLTVTDVTVQAQSMQIEEGASVTAAVTDAGGAASLAADISGAGDMAKTGAGTLNLTGNNAGYTGTVTISGGTVNAGTSTALGNTPNVVMAGNGVELSGSIAPTGDINITSTASGTVSAKIDMAEGATLTFNTINQVNEEGEPVTTTVTATGTITGDGGIFKDGKGTLVLNNDANTFTGGVDIKGGTVLVTDSGALGASGNRNVNVENGSSLAFATGVTEPYRVNTVSVSSGSSLVFSGTNQLHIDTLNITAASAMDLTNISLDNYGSYVLATVDSFVPAEVGIWKPGKNLVEFVSMIGIHGSALTPDSLVSLYYEGGQLVLKLNKPNDGFYWKPSEETGVTTWNTKDDNWSSTPDLSDKARFVNEQTTATTGERARSAYFMNEGEEHIVMGINGTTYVRDMIVANGKYYFTAPEGTETSISLSTTDLSNFVVRKGAEAHFDGVSVATGEKDVIHICSEATATMENVSNWGVYSINNEGTFSVDSNCFGIGESILGHVDNTGDFSAYYRTENGLLLIGEMANREGSKMVLSGYWLAANEQYGDGFIANDGELTFDATGFENGQMYNYIPVAGIGTLETKGEDRIVFSSEEAFIYYTASSATVEQTAMTLGAAENIFGEAVQIADSTTVLSGSEAAFYGGGSLGDLALTAGGSDNLTKATLGGYNHEGTDIHDSTYNVGAVTAGENTVLTVENGAVATVGSYNAGDTPAGTIVVGAPTSQTSGTYSAASLTVNGLTNVETLDVQNGTANLVGYATVGELTQSGGTLNLNAGGYVENATVSGGTLHIGNGKVLTLGDVITENGSYTVAATTGSINADALTLEMSQDNVQYTEIGYTGTPTATQSGFLSSGEQYVKVFDIQSGTLTGNDVTVTHKDAAGPMKLISTGKYAGYGYLDSSETVYTTYYVRDNYVTGAADDRTDVHGKHTADEVKLSDITSAATAGGETLAAVVFDQTNYNSGVKNTNYHGTLTVDENTKADLFTVTENTRAAINIASNAVVLADKDYAGVEGTLELAGSGVYQIDNRGDLGENVSLLANEKDGISPWEGTVRLTGTAEDLDMAPLSVGVAGNASTIEFNQWTGTFAATEKPMESDAKILLTGTGTVDAPAITFAATESDAPTRLVWTNTVTGENAGMINQTPGDVEITMTGDTSGWGGTFYQDSAESTATLNFLPVGAGDTQNATMLVEAGTLNVTYGGDLKVVNGAASLTGADAGLNLAYTGTNMQVNSDISQYHGQGNLSITVGDDKGTEASASFNGAFSNTQGATMTVKENAVATFNREAPLLRVVGEEGSNVVVSGGVKLSLASIDPENSYSEFHGLTNDGTIEMQADGGDILLVADEGADDTTFKVGSLDLVGTSGTAAIETVTNGQSVEVQITQLSGPSVEKQVLELKNISADGTVDYKLGGTTHYTGTIEFGSGVGEGNANVVLESEGVAANAVLRSTGSSSSTADVVVNTENAQVKGIDSTGDVDGTLYGDGSRRTVTITGDGPGSFSYNGALGENLDIAYTGSGRQSFEGGADDFSGKVTVDNGSNAVGVLEILNASSVHISDLTIGANNTLDINDGKNVGIAEVSGTMKARGTAGNYSKLDGDLTMGSGSTYDVSAAGGKGGLDLLGGALTISNGATLSANDIANIYNMEIGDMYDLAFDVATFNGSTTASGFEDKVPFGNPIDASTLFGGDQFWKGEYYVCFSATANGGKGDNVGTVYLYKATPEPTTGTLSLLALAALAARRRRK